MRLGITLGSWLGRTSTHAQRSKITDAPLYLLTELASQICPDGQDGSVERPQPTGMVTARQAWTQVCADEGPYNCASADGYSEFGWYARAEK